MEINSQILTDVIQSYRLVHNDQIGRFGYYKGNHFFLNSEIQADGKKKNNTAINFLKYIVDTHTASNTSNTLKILNRKNNQPFEVIEDLYNNQDLDTVDSEHFKYALINGYSVEVHSYINSKIKIQNYPAWQWSFVFDENDEIVIGIHHGEIPKYTVFQGEFLNKPKTLFTVYTDAFIVKYVYGDDKNTLIEIERKPHFYSKPPIVLFAVSKDKSPFISDNLIGASNQYNKTYNARLDVIENNADAILRILGANIQDPSTVEAIKFMKENRIIVLQDSNTQIDFISKPSDASIYEKALSDAEDNLFSLGVCVSPKRLENYGNTSASALRIKMEATIKQSKIFMRYFEVAIRKRIDLINVILKLKNQPIIENYDVISKFDMQVDISNIAQSANNLKEVASYEQIQKLLFDYGLVKNIEEQQINSDIQNVPLKEEIQDPQVRLEQRNKAIDNVSNKIQPAIEKTLKPNLENTSSLETVLKKVLG